MPVAVIQEWAEGGSETTNYDAINQRLRESEAAPEGFLMHAAGATPAGGFNIIEVWESREHFDRFVAEQLMPILRDLQVSGDEAAAPTVTTYELRNFVSVPSTG